jgi:hypothetical protein
VWRTEPDDDEEGFPLPPHFLRELHGFIHDQLRAFARDDFRRRAVAAERRVHLEEIVVGQIFVETHPGRIHGGIFFHRSDVPFAEMTGAVAGLLEDLCDRDLLRARGVVRREGPGAVGVAAGHHARASRRTHGRTGIKTVEAQRRA